MSYLDSLNDRQRAAVTATDGPVLVVAGPGSGKTRVLTYRIAYLIEQGAPPWEILSLTFTNKAAREMKERISKVIGDRGQRVWAGTFHSIFARILRSEAERIGFPSNFSIYDTDDAKSLLRSVIKEMSFDKDSYHENAILTRISSAKSNLITPKIYGLSLEMTDAQIAGLPYERQARMRQYLEVSTKLMSQDTMSRRPFIYKIYEEYVKRCKQAGAMDFDDLLYNFYMLLTEHPEVCKKYQDKFKYILVDEFQDTNQLQYAILRKLADYPGSLQNICVVGDDAQSIYAFRGATIDNILDFERDFKRLRTFKLEQNYRSTGHIVHAANEVILNNRKQIQKSIWTDRGEGQLIAALKTSNDQEEAKRVVDMIFEHKNRHHLANKEIAILYRTNAQSRAFEEALRRVNIPYRVYGGTSFYDRKEVKDVLAYLRLVVNQRDDEALKRIINYPTRGIGDATIAKIAAMANGLNKSMWETLREYPGTPRERTALNGFALLIENFMQRAQRGSAHDIALYVVKQSQLMDKLKHDTTIEGLGRIENVNALLNAIAEFCDDDEIQDDLVILDKTLPTYLQNIALVTNADLNDPQADVITLMSVHSAKGLEYKSVFVTGMEEDLFPSLMAKDTPQGLDEERRLFYVAITRAELYLTLSFSGTRYRFGALQYTTPSRFLNEINPTHFEGFKEREASASDGRSRVTGAGIGRPQPGLAPPLGVDLANFKAAAPSTILPGLQVLHQRFGHGEVLSVEGVGAGRVATIRFKGAENAPKKIMLNYAKLQILNE
jgi:DNA helicase II / ATP-dependent DNA helicase PcrA